MTLCNVILSRDAIQIWTDGAAYEEDGTMRHTIAKVAPLPHLGCAVALRGIAIAMPLLWYNLNRRGFDTFDDMVARLRDVVREVRFEHSDLIKAVSPTWGFGSVFEVFLAGWSESRKRAEAYRVRSDILTVEATEKAFLTPADQSLMAALKAEFPHATDADIHRPKIARRIAELQRTRGEGDTPDGGRERWNVGGFLQLTTITRSNITTEIVRRWPEQVGRVIGNAA